jgi:hypothetical protein
MALETKSPYQHLEKLVALGTGEGYLDAVRDAKARYFRAAGEVFEDDPFFEPRMNCFLEYYLFDFSAGPGGKSTTALVIERGKETLSADELVAFAGFDRSIHSIFEFKKKAGDLLHVVNLYDGENYEVFERRTLAGLDKSDIFEARLLPFGDKLHFSNAFVFHPKEVKKFVVAELKTFKEQGPPKPTGVVHRLAYLRLKFDRFRRVDAAKIYSRETMAQVESEQKRELGAKE